MIEETSAEMYRDLERVHPKIKQHQEHFRHTPVGFGDWFAKKIVHLSARGADLLFQKRYGHRAIVLETIAAVPGMVGGMLQHLKSLRLIHDDRGWIKALLDEAENERMHLIIYSQITKPSFFERILIMVVQVLFFILYFILYFTSPWTAHRVVGYFEEEAIHSYETYLRLIHEGVHDNIPATLLAKIYWNLKDDARLSDIVEATIKDEMLHRDVNHAFAEDKHAGLWFA